MGAVGSQGREVGGSLASRDPTLCRIAGSKLARARSAGRSPAVPPQSLVGTVPPTTFREDWGEGGGHGAMGRWGDGARARAQQAKGHLQISKIRPDPRQHRHSCSAKQPARVEGGR
jgi:hypothetical protein